jgi:hypothetical protein
MIYSHRGADSGPQADPDDSGYDRAIFAPGLALTVQDWKFYADVEIPVAQHMNGDQLTSPAALKFIVSHDF